MPSASDKVNIETLAKALIFEIAEGYMFVTQEGDLVGPSKDREEATAKAALYLAAWRDSNVR